jgi:hypothetical protein
MRVLIVGEGTHEEAGALQTLVERLAGRALDCQFRRVREANLHAHHGKTSGMEKKAIRWMLDARKEGYDALVFLVDEDGYRDRLKQAERAQEDRTSDIGRAVGVAVRTFDAWMLSDEQALAEVLGIAVGRQPEPELQKNPKGDCAELLANSNAEMSQREFYREIVRQLSIAKLSERCPLGFAPFAERVDLLFKDKD